MTDERPIGEPYFELVLNKLMEVQKAQNEIRDSVVALEDKLFGRFQPDGRIPRLEAWVGAIERKVNNIRKWDRADLTFISAAVSTVVYCFGHVVLVLWKSYGRGR